MTNLQFDGDGFLTNPEVWNDKIAMQIAQEDGIDMTNQHWAIIRVIRQNFGRIAVVALVTVSHAYESPIGRVFSSVMNDYLVGYLGPSFSVPFLIFIINRCPYRYTMHFFRVISQFLRAYLH